MRFISTFQCTLSNQPMTHTSPSPLNGDTWAPDDWANVQVPFLRCDIIESKPISILVPPLFTICCIVWSHVQNHRFLSETDSLQNLDCDSEELVRGLSLVITRTNKVHITRSLKIFWQRNKEPKCGNRTEYRQDKNILDKNKDRISFFE